MDTYHLLRKGLTVGIILLFVATIIIPLTAQNRDKPPLSINTPSTNENNDLTDLNDDTMPHRCATANDNPRYLINITERDIFRNGVDSTVFEYPNDLNEINGIGYVVSCYSNSLVVTDSTDESNIIQTAYKQDDTFLYFAHGIAVTPDQKFAYTITYGTGSYLCMWNVTNIYATPIRLNQTYLPSETGMYLELLGNYLILTTKSKIHIYDITNRNTTRQMTQLSSFSYSTVNSSTYYWHTLVVGNILYVASAYTSTRGGFVVFNITNKSTPTEVRRVNDTINFLEFHQYYWHGFHYLISEGQAVPTTYYKGYIYVYNFSSGTLDNPTFLYRKCTNHNNSWLAACLFDIINGYVFSMQLNYNMSTHSGIQVWNLTDINNPSYVTGLNGNGAPNYLHLCHDEVFDQNGSDRTLYVLTQIDNSLVTIGLTWAGNENPNKPPNANFTYSIQGLSVMFNASTSHDPDGTITTWQRDFGDNTNGAGETITHLYPASGTYNVTLTVTDNEGANNSATQRITVKAPEFQKAFIFGRITNLSRQGEYITFKAIKTRVIIFSPFSFNTYMSGEKFTIAKVYQGLIGVRYIFALCKILI